MMSDGERILADAGYASVPNGWGGESSEWRLDARDSSGVKLRMIVNIGEDGVAIRSNDLRHAFTGADLKSAVENGIHAMMMEDSSLPPYKIRYDAMVSDELGRLKRMLE